ncbi:MAG: IS1595 family transposase [Bryobacteraceae bacterium]|jgi:transposase-like protein
MHPSSVITPSPLGSPETVQIPTTLLEAMRFYRDPDVAARTLAAARWGDATECLHCHSREQHWYISTRRIWKCRACRKQFSPKAGTIFEDSPIHLDRWLIAIWMVANSEHRVSSYKLNRVVGVTQTTAQFMLRRIRLAVQSAQSKGEAIPAFEATDSQ